MHQIPFLLEQPTSHSLSFNWAVSPLPVYLAQNLQGQTLLSMGLVKVWIFYFILFYLFIIIYFNLLSIRFFFFFLII